MTSLAALIHGELDEGAMPSTDAVSYHRLAPLAFDRTRGIAFAADWRDALRPHVVDAAGRDMVQTAALRELLRLAAGLDLLVMKGAAHGPLLYGDGALRPRYDIDVWLADWDAAEALARRLAEAGYRRAHQLPGQLARHAIAMSRGELEQIDVHAACSRRIRVARAVPFAAAWRERQPFGVEGSAAYTLCARDAWLLGALHLEAHHAGQLAPLVLVEDLRRLALRCSSRDWQRIWERAAAHGLLTALRSGAEQLASWAPGAMDPAFWAALNAAPVDESARFFTPTTAMLDDLDLLSPADARAYVREIAYPPADYLRAHFGTARDRPRALLAGYRLASGVVARLAGRGHNRGD